MVDGWDYQSQTVVEWLSPYLIRNCIIIIADKRVSQSTFIGNACSSMDDI